jgi:hypothetical protein
MDAKRVFVSIDVGCPTCHLPFGPSVAVASKPVVGGLDAVVDDVVEGVLSVIAAA